MHIPANILIQSLKQIEEEQKDNNIKPTVRVIFSSKGMEIIKLDKFGNEIK